jgi:hypothetical protein
MVYGRWVLSTFMGAIATNRVFGLETTNVEIYESKSKISLPLLSKVPMVQHETFSLP